MKRCVVIGGRDIDFPIKHLVTQNDYVICADRGWLQAEKNNIKPDLIVGDFDSSPSPIKKYSNTITLPHVKDDTDTHYIAKIAVENGCTDILMLGVLGGERIEHSFANISTMLYLSKHRINVTAISKYSRLTVITNGKIILQKGKSKYFSIFPLGEEASRVNVSGGKYNLTNYTLKNDYPIGISNEFVNETAEIEVKNGSLLIVMTDKD